MRERTIFSSLLLLEGVLACLLQSLGVGSAAIFFLSALPMFFALVTDLALSNPGREVSLWSYVVGQLVPLTTGAQLTFAVLDVFVPLVSIATRTIVPL